MKLLIIPNFDKEKTAKCVNKIIKNLSDSGCSFLFHSRYEDNPACSGGVFGCDYSSLLGECDLVLAIGGDGTIIHAAKKAAEMKKPILGINTGRLGFIADLESSEHELLKKLLIGEYVVEQRMMLDVEVYRGGSEKILSCHSMNDAVVSRGAESHLISMQVRHNDRLTMGYRSDGLIVCTPTGSTAYSLSAGGPVIDPMVKCITLTPVCAHSLVSRPIIFDADSNLSIEIMPRHEELYNGSEKSRDLEDYLLSVDGDLSISLRAGDVVRVAKSEMTAGFISIKQQSFAERLIKKFQ